MRWQWVLLFICGALVGCEKPSETVPESVAKVKTVEVGELAKGQLRRLSGKIKASDESTLSFAVSGSIEKVLVNPGDSVTQGQVLASLERRPFELALKNARAQLNITRAQLVEKQKSYQRYKSLRINSAIAQADIDVAEANYSTARENLAAAQSSLEKAERDLLQSSIIAPFEGQIADRLIEPFQEITAGGKAFVLQSKGSFDVEVLVPETMIRQVDYGQQVRVYLPSLENVTLTGNVIEIGSQVQAGNAFPTIIKLLPSSADLRAGMSASVSFTFYDYPDQQPIYLIPITALAIDDVILGPEGDNTAEQSLAVVYVYEPSSESVKLRQVEIGGLRGNQLEVYSGLRAGEHVVTAGVAFLREGMKVALWNPEVGLSE